MTPDTPSTDQLVGDLRAGLTTRAAAATDPRITVGRRVVLCDCHHPRFGPLAGVAHRPSADEHGSRWHSTEGTDADVDAATDEGRWTVGDLLELAGAPAGSVDRAVGLATLNALSAPDVDWRPGDPMASLSADVDVVTTVGLFRPAFRKFANVEVRVVERPSVDVALDESTLPDGVSVRFYRPDERAAAVADADVCFVTGATLVYGGIDDYLDAASVAGVPLTVLIGATASFRPEPAFAAGVDLLAGVRVTDVDRLRTRVAAGDCGTGLHDAGLEKVYVAAHEPLPEVAFAASRATDDTGDETTEPDSR